jgi:general secretion pathway protein G
MTGERVTAAERDGFTLIELLVVMSIIATLLLIAVPRYFQSLERSREAVLREDLSAMRDAIDKYYADIAQYPETLGLLVEKRYLRRIPVDPQTRSDATWVTIANDDPELPGIRDIHSGATGNAMDGTAYASW